MSKHPLLFLAACREKLPASRSISPGKARSSARRRRRARHAVAPCGSRFRDDTCVRTWSPEGVNGCGNTRRTIAASADKSVAPIEARIVLHAAVMSPPEGARQQLCSALIERGAHDGWPRHARRGRFVLRQRCRAARRRVAYAHNAFQLVFASSRFRSRLLAELVPLSES